MNRLQFAQLLREAIIASLREFTSEHPDEWPYGFALILGQYGNDLRFAIATEEGLLRTVARYVDIGYQYEDDGWPEIDSESGLAVWRRWAHPDNGWFYGDFSERFEITERLKILVSDDAFGKGAKQLEEFCTDVLTSLQTNTDWEALQDRTRIIVGVYEGDDPRDFLRTATRCNPYATVRRLWGEYWQAEEYSSRITSPYGRANG